jgi:hypothetical protein
VGVTILFLSHNFAPLHLDLTPLPSIFLEHFHSTGFIHTDVYWRNIGYFKDNGQVTVVLLDLHPTRVYRDTNDGTWIKSAIEKLRGRANVNPEMDDAMSFS